MDWRVVNRGIALVGFGFLVSCENQGKASSQSSADASTDSQETVAALFLPQDGNRIKVRWGEAASGKRNWDGFVDTELHTDCSFRRAMDGELRCLPYGISLASHYADPNCATPAIVIGHAECEPPEFIIRSDNGNSCMTRERIYRRGKKISTVYVRTYPSGMPSECNPSPQFSTSAAFELGEELPVGRFVKAVDVPPQKTDLSAAIELSIRHAEDGFRHLASYYNMATQTECNMYSANQVDHYHCYPQLARALGYAFSDDQCQKPSAYFVPACEAQPTLAILSIPKTCPTQYQLFSMGPRVDKLFAMTEGICNAMTATTGRQYHSDLQAVSASGYPLIAYRMEEHAGARLLRRSGGGTTAGQRSVTRAWYDTLRKEVCYPVQSSTGKTRCIPAYSTFQGFYSDAACTRLLWRTAPDLCSPNYVVRWDYQSCPVGALVYKVGSNHTQPVYQMVSYKYGNNLEAECELREKPVAGESFQALTAIPETEFAELTLISPP